ncbi:unnamed protein product [Aphanomyces euteiches]|uniref:Uncharacterized protein n=1 Tax=Aphanomyces euteiches TaxID=100861 RepID=A0A6G0XUF7_9STRA|nr:hypothetical protein Ae201684_001328 [Aphanomyces euteiches]KAH9099330.1 hypothetical protein Ae201684P_018346 [Aphanomyces euteiches]KAH9139619.1 hypothetical protein AeRB84_016096 [Aphanomyces euteiches]
MRDLPLAPPNLLDHPTALAVVGAFNLVKLALWSYYAYVARDPSRPVALRYSCIAKSLVLLINVLASGCVAVGALVVVLPSDSIEGRLRSVFVMRWIDSIVSRPLVLLDLLAVAGTDWPLTIFAMTLEVSFVLLDLQADLCIDAFAFYFNFSLSCVVYLVLLAVVYFEVMAPLKRIGDAARPLLTLFTALLTMRLFYPVRTILLRYRHETIGTIVVDEVATLVTKTLFLAYSTYVAIEYKDQLRVVQSGLALTTPKSAGPQRKTPADKTQLRARWAKPKESTTPAADDA